MAPPRMIVHMQQISGGEFSGWQSGCLSLFHSTRFGVIFLNLGRMARLWSGGARAIYVPMKMLTWLMLVARRTSGPLVRHMFRNGRNFSDSAGPVRSSCLKWPKPMRPFRMRMRWKSSH